MDKQEMVRCLSNMCEGEICLHREPHLATDVCEMNVRGCGVCQPVEPAQPELPRELPLVKIEPHNYECSCGTGTSEEVETGLNIQQEADQLILNKWIGMFEDSEEWGKGWLDRCMEINQEKEQALKRIAELEEMKVPHKVMGKVRKQEAEIASLKEQLAVNWLDAPTQAGMYWMSPFCDGGYRYPHMKEVIDFDRPGRGLEVVESLSDCVPIDLYLREYYPKSKWLYLKAPGCPVPAKEEEK